MNKSSEHLGFHAVFVRIRKYAHNFLNYFSRHFLETLYNWAFHGIGIGSIIKLGQKEPRPIQTFTVCAALTRSIETKIGLGQRKMLKFSKKKNVLFN